MIADIEFSGDAATGEMGILEGFVIFTFSTSIDSDDSEYIPAMKFPLLDRATFEHTHAAEDATSIITVTLNLTVGKE